MPLTFIVVLAANATTEADIRSAVIVAMLRFTTWENPDIAVKESLQLCSFGSPLSQESLDIGIREAPPFGKNLSHHQLKNFDKVAACDVLILGPKTGRVISSEVLTNKLSICDGCTINKNFVIANLELIDNSVKFDINLRSAEKAGIKLSSDLLSLANEVKGKPDNAES